MIDFPANDEQEETAETTTGKRYAALRNIALFRYSGGNIEGLVAKRQHALQHDHESNKSANERSDYAKRRLRERIERMSNANQLDT